MSEARSQKQPVPPELLGPLVEATRLASQPAALRASFSEQGYVLLRGALEREEVLTARREVFARLAEMEEIQTPVETGIATGRSRRQELGGDLGAFWKSVSEGPLLRRVTHGMRL